MVNQLLDGLTEIEIEEIRGLPEDLRQAYFKAREEREKYGSYEKSPTYQTLWAKDYTEKPVSVSEFLTSPDYLGGLGIYEKWHYELEYVLDPENEIYEWICTGAIGTGKTTAACLALSRKIYELYCLTDPHQYFSMMPGSMIIFGLYNVFKYKVDTSSWNYMTAIMNESPWFRERFQRNPEENKLAFPNNVSVIAGSSELHALGDNLYSVLIDEANFMQKGTILEERGQAQRLYDNTLRRIESRFKRFGKIPGLLAFVSSKKDESDYLEEHIRESKDNQHVHISDFSLWDVKADRYSKTMFRVQVGNKYRSSKVLKLDELPEKDTKVIEVPEDFRTAFERDPDASLRDIAGVATYSLSPLVYSPERVLQGIDPTRRHPFFLPEISISLDEDDPIDGYLRISDIFRVAGSYYKPRLNPTAARFLHVDIGLTRDALGIAMGHVSKVEYRRTEKMDGTISPNWVPHICIDFMLRIKPEKGSEIDLGAVRQFIFFLVQNGFFLKRISYDGFQSRDSIQIFKKAGWKLLSTRYQSHGPKDSRPTITQTSVDRTDEAYLLLRQIHDENRISMYEYDIYYNEFIKLIHDKGKRKVDHPKNGSKDVSDAVAGVVWNCINDNVFEGQTEQVKIQEQPPETVPVFHKMAKEKAAWLAKMNNPAMQNYSFPLSASDMVPEREKPLPQQGFDWLLSDYKGGAHMEHYPGR